MLVDDKLAPGDAVTLSFTAPTLWDPLVLAGKVAWVASPADGMRGVDRAGVAFRHDSTDVVFALYELISTLAYE